MSTPIKRAVCWVVRRRPGISLNSAVKRRTSGDVGGALVELSGCRALAILEAFMHVSCL